MLRKIANEKCVKILAAASLVGWLTIAPAAPTARADIFEWEYVDPSLPYLGKQPSLILTPDGAGAYALPGTNLANFNLTKAYLIGSDLTGAFIRVG